MEINSSVFWRCLFAPLLSAMLACGGVGSGSDSSTNSTDKVSSASRSLRLGQTDDADSRVAVSVAINNQESLVVLNSSAGNSDIAQVLYRGADGEVALISVNSSGVPLSATTSDSSVVFKNYNGSTVDVTITSSGAVTEATGVSVSSSSARQLVQNSARSLSTDQLRSVLQAALLAVRTFGCASQRAAGSGQVSSSFRQLAGNSCGSLLLDTVSQTVQTQPNDLQQFVTQVPNNASCAEAPTASSFTFAQRCANAVGAATVVEALRQAPSIAAASSNLPPEEVVQQTSGFDPISGVDTTHPTNSPFLGKYAGTVIDDFTDSGTECGGNSKLLIEIVSVGDPLCLNPLCRLDGFVENPPPPMGSPPPPDSNFDNVDRFSATVQRDGRFSFRKTVSNNDTVNLNGEVRTDEIFAVYRTDRGCTGRMRAVRVR